MLILYFEKLNFWRHHELVGSSRVGNLAGRVGSQKMYPWTSLLWLALPTAYSPNPIPNPNPNPNPYHELISAASLFSLTNCWSINQSINQYFIVQ